MYEVMNVEHEKDNYFCPRPFSLKISWTEDWIVLQTEVA